MHILLLPSIAVLATILEIAAALSHHVEEAKHCSWSPLLGRQDQLTCAAPRPKEQTQPTVDWKVEIPELWDEHGERYLPPKAYKLAPPWVGPEQCFTEFCLFSNRDAGQGMALVTTARNAYLTAHYPAPPASGVEPTAFYEEEVPGKGIGLIANRKIRKGEIIMQRVPALLIQDTVHMDLDPEVREQLYQTAVDRLPEATQERFLRQMGNTLFDKVEKNAFRMFVDGDHKHSLHLGVLPEVSRFNHDCRPNVHYRIANLTHTTIAVRDILPGEELTISYIYPQVPKSERQSRLREWGFVCTCSQCTLPPSESSASDNRIRQIKQLEEEIEAIMARGPGGEGLRPEMGGKLVELYLQERLHAYLGPTYTRAALIYSMFGNEQRAREYAREAVGALEREVGPHARDLESMRRLAEDPRGHWSWGIKVTSGRAEVGRNKTDARGK
ncbi:SET domain-containing protein 5 [Achaetomium macrosporum]|uniref:SET domain-containing protein 5 n=1 Tax=Achaetomium macrosporum TaxID=79813 RepID=A0AAN7CE78_9PEZI|nr:SET domain-containing protein 5 [Achaetomium macrosporum]